MIAWRGVIVQLSCLAALVAMVIGTKDSNLIWTAVGIVGSVLGQTVARARVTAGIGQDGNGNGGTPSSTSKVLPAVLGVLTTFLIVGCFFLFAKVLH